MQSGKNVILAAAAFPCRETEHKKLFQPNAVVQHTHNLTITLTVSFVPQKKNAHKFFVLAKNENFVHFDYCFKLVEFLICPLSHRVTCCLPARLLNVNLGFVGGGGNHPIDEC